MGVIAEFTVDGDDFALKTPEYTDFEVEFESAVPVGTEVLPSAWVWGSHEKFEDTLDTCQYIQSYRAVETVGEKRLYRFEWDEAVHDVLSCFVETDGTVLRIRGGAQWRFTVRFPGDANVSHFHSMCRTRGISLELHRLSHVTEAEATNDNEYGLTGEQREALVYAVQTGYFSIPRRSTLDDIAKRFDISNQAASERIRRATESVLQQALGDELDVLVEQQAR
ncbi:helix-turn-helix domain-containing protein [Haloarchaeobius sp. DFWS5]|uniref:helix-turn-helix domain-containing protein n=1 Tax=Haloarchaeobius sp. DFWS5 TaxID=3446114 RepID=UPI003EBD1A2C